MEQKLGKQQSQTTAKQTENKSLLRGDHRRWWRDCKRNIEHFSSPLRKNKYFAKGDIKMKAYIIKIVGAALIGTFSEYLVPREWKKYVKLISGILMLSIMLIPFKADTEQIFFEQTDTVEYSEEGQENLAESIRLQLEKDVAEDIVKRVSEEFSKKVGAEVKINSTADGKIESVGSITLFGDEDSEITERLKYVYGTDMVIWIKE